MASVGVSVVVALATLIVLIMLQQPIAFALATSGVLGLVLLEGPSFVSQMIARVSFLSVSSFTLVILPLFILMGTFVREGRMASDSFRVLSRMVGRFPGGLGIASIGACSLFAAVSGSSAATVASVGRISMDEMLKYGYDKRLAAGIVGAAGTLGVLIPPSVVLVLFGIVTGESIGDLLIAGIIPGMLSGAMYVFVVVYRAKRTERITTKRARLHSDAPSADRASKQGTVDSRQGELNETPAGSYWGVLQVVVLGSLVIGGIYSGIFTATEAAGVGALVAGLMMVLDVRGRQGHGLRRQLTLAWSDAASSSSMVLGLIIGGGIFSHFIVLSGIARDFSVWVSDLNVPPGVVVVLILLAFIPMGMALDGLSMLLIAVPLTYPAVVELGFDGVWYGIMVVKMIEIGLITPPVGMNAFVVAGVSKDITIDDAFRGAFWFVPVDLLTIAILFVFPELVTWLPSVMRP